MSLKLYTKKRKFKETPEPRGKILKRKNKSLVFVVQKHQASHLHYDLRLEKDGVMKSWAVPKGPSMDPSVKRLAMQVEDHPISYNTFEGIIPEGNYGAGVVKIWDKGIYAPLDPRGFHTGELKFVMYGKKLKGGFALVRIKPKEGTDDKRHWLLIKERDEYAKKNTKKEKTKSKR